MIAARQDLDDRRDFPFALDWLVGVGIGAERDRRAHVTGSTETERRRLRRVGLREQLRFEIETRRQIGKSVRRPYITIDAAVLAALVGIDRLVERNVRRIVAAMIERARAIVTVVLIRGGASSAAASPSAGGKGGASAVVDRFPLVAAEPVRRIECRAAALDRRGRTHR